MPTMKSPSRDEGPYLVWLSVVGVLYTGSVIAVILAEQASTTVASCVSWSFGKTMDPIPHQSVTTLATRQPLIALWRPTTAYDTHNEQPHLYVRQWRSQRGGGARGPCPPKLLVNFPINLLCYVLLGCRVKNVILACLKNQYWWVRFLTSLRWFVNPVVYGGYTVTWLQPTAVDTLPGRDLTIAVWNTTLC